MSIPGSLRSLALTCAVSAGWAFSFGLGAPLASLWLQDKSGTDPDVIYTLIGLNTGTYYFGIALTAPLVPWMMRRWRHGCPAVGMVLSGLTVALFPWGGSHPAWFALRAVNGVAGAMSLIPVETLVNRTSSVEQRGRNFGFYAFAVALGWALGNLVGLQMYPDLPRTAFMLGGVLAVVAGIGVAGWLRWPTETHTGVQPDRRLEPQRNFLSFGSAWSQGYLEGGMVAFLSIYLLVLGLSEVRVSWVTSGIMIGVILFQVPVAWLADRLGRTRVLLGCYAITAAGLALLPWCGDSLWLVSWLFLVGACSGAFYPLGLALLGDRVSSTALARASAWYLAINCVGSLMGPSLTGKLMDQFGKRAMFASGEAAILLVLALAAVCRWRTLRARPAEQDLLAASDVAARHAA
jgi:MFS family permease